MRSRRTSSSACSSSTSVRRKACPPPRSSTRSTSCRRVEEGADGHCDGGGRCRPEHLSAPCGAPNFFWRPGHSDRPSVVRKNLKKHLKKYPFHSVSNSTQLISIRQRPAGPAFENNNREFVSYVPRLMNTLIRRQAAALKTFVLKGLRPSRGVPLLFGFALLLGASSSAL